MCPFLRASAPRSARRAAVARLTPAALAAALAACADGAPAPPTAPAAASRAAASRAAVAPPAASPTVEVAVQVIAAGTRRAVTDGFILTIRAYGSAPRTVADNGAGDQDPLASRVRAAVPAAMSYTVCVIAAAPRYAVGAPSCVTRDGGGPVVDVEVLLHRPPTLGFNLRDLAGSPVAGGAVRVTGPGGYDRTVADAGPDDASSATGGIGLYLPGPGTYAWCETTRPPGYQFTNPRCGTVAAEWDVAYIPMLFHFPALNPAPPWVN
jgi:hypothetical protein